MFDWWNVLGSLTRIHVWAQVCTGLFLVLSASAAFLTFRTGARITQLKAQAAMAKAAHPAVKPPASRPMEPAGPEAKPVAEPPKPAAEPPKAAEPVRPSPLPDNVPRPVAVVPPPRVDKPADVIPPPEAVQRHLSGALREKLISLLKERPKGKVGISFMKGDEESQAFSAEIAGILASAGWETERMGAMPDFPGAKGYHFMIKSPGSEPENTKFIIHSFIEAGLKPNTELNHSLQENQLLLVVGHK